jgi:hypothetical protein
LKTISIAMGVSHSAFVVEGDKDKIAKLPM